MCHNVASVSRALGVHREFMKCLYVYISPAGDFYICRIRRYYLAYFDSQLIGSFNTPREAAQSAAAGQNIVLPAGVGFDELHVPAELAEWKEIE